MEHQRWFIQESHWKLCYNNAGLDECINQIQRKKREIIQARREARQLKNRPRKVQTTPMNNLDKYHKTSKGYISVDPNEYVKQLMRKRKKFKNTMSSWEKHWNKRPPMPPMPQVRNKNSFHQRQELIEYYQTCLQIHPLQVRKLKWRNQTTQNGRRKRSILTSMMMKRRWMNDGMDHPTPPQGASELSNQYS